MILNDAGIGFKYLIIKEMNCILQVNNIFDNIRMIGSDNFI